MRLVNPPATLALRLLGEVTLRRGDQPLAGLPSRKAEALLIYLACTRRPIAREVLADLLWDDRPYQTALSNLRTLLSGLRRVVGPVVVVERDTVRFDTTQPYVLDVETFERGLAASEPSTELQTACDLYQGDFLAGFHLRQSRGFEEWAVVERERLRRLAVNGLDRLVRQAIDVGQYAAGLEAADRLTQFEPLSEAAHQQRMHLLARLGRRAGFWERRRLRKGALEDWAWESRDISRDVAYAKLPAARPAVLGEEYFAAALPSVEGQIRRGGVRLAQVLNETLGK